MNRDNDYGSHNNLNLKFLIALSRSHNAIGRQSNTLFKAHGLTTMQFSVLEVLYHKGDLCIGQIIRKILATGGNMTVVADNLHKLGYVEKYSAPHDQRVTMLHITKKGEEVIEAIFPQHLEQLNTLLQPLTPQEKKELIHILKKLNLQ